MHIKKHGALAKTFRERTQERCIPPPLLIRQFPRSYLVPSHHRILLDSLPIPCCNHYYNTHSSWKPLPTATWIPAYQQCVIIFRHLSVKRIIPLSITAPEAGSRNRGGKTSRFHLRSNPEPTPTVFFRLHLGSYLRQIMLAAWLLRSEDNSSILVVDVAQTNKQTNKQWCFILYKTWYKYHFLDLMIDEASRTN